jgi:hypothetical protein
MMNWFKVKKNPSQVSVIIDSIFLLLFAARDSCCCGLGLGGLLTCDAIHRKHH